MLIPEVLKKLSQSLDLLGDQITEAELQELLLKYPITYSAVEPWVTFQDSGYTRNVMIRTQHHEILCCCWLPGQSSPIHDHVKSKSFVTVLSGVATEHLFSDHLGKARFTLLRHLDQGAVYGEVGLIHRLGNQVSNNIPLVTLHIYLPPIELNSPDDYPGGRVFEEEKV